MNFAAEKAEQTVFDYKVEFRYARTGSPARTRAPKPMLGRRRGQHPMQSNRRIGRRSNRFAW
jgi:hypothetical protein